MVPISLVSTLPLKRNNFFLFSAKIWKKSKIRSGGHIRDVTKTSFNPILWSGIRSSVPRKFFSKFLKIVWVWNKNVPDLKNSQLFCPTVKFWVKPHTPHIWPKVWKGKKKFLRTPLVHEIYGLLSSLNFNVCTYEVKILSCNTMYWTKVC